MKKSEKLRICNWSLLALLVLTLASGIQLEVIHGGSVLYVWCHIVIAILFTAFAVYHIELHFGWKKWFSKFDKLKSNVTKILWWLFLLTVLSGVVALIHWLTADGHSPIGGVHGKIGFLMIAFAIGHTAKRIKFFKRKAKE